jgi:hypothetical protein
MADGELLGLAAIGFRPFNTGASSIGGLLTGRLSRDIVSFSESYVGLLERTVEGPRRLGGAYAGDPADLAVWASEQASILLNESLSEKELYFACGSVAAFGGDPSPIARMYLNRTLTPIEEIFKHLTQGAEILAVIDTHHDKIVALSHATFEISPGAFTGFSYNEIVFEGLVLEGFGLSGHGENLSYLAVPTAEYPSNNGFLACLIKYCKQQGHTLSLGIAEEVILGRYVGVPSERSGLYKDTEIRDFALKLSLTPEK